MIRIFSYGTLRDTRLQKRLTGRIWQGEADALRGFSIRQVSYGSRHYPMLFASDEDAEVEGMCYLVSESELRILDRYEGDGYRRILCTCRSGKDAIVYVSAGESQR